EAEPSRIQETLRLPGGAVEVLDAREAQVPPLMQVGPLRDAPDLFERRPDEDLDVDRRRHAAEPDKTARSLATRSDERRAKRRGPPAAAPGALSLWGMPPAAAPGACPSGQAGAGSAAPR